MKLHPPVSISIINVNIGIVIHNLVPFFFSASFSSMLDFSHVPFLLSLKSIDS